MCNPAWKLGLGWLGWYNNDKMYWFYRIVVPTLGHGTNNFSEIQLVSVLHILKAIQKAMSDVILVELKYMAKILKISPCALNRKVNSRRYCDGDWKNFDDSHQQYDNLLSRAKNKVSISILSILKSIKRSSIFPNSWNAFSIVIESSWLMAIKVVSCLEGFSRWCWVIDYGPAHFNFLTNSVIDFSQWGAGKSMMRPFVDRWINWGGGRRASSLLIGRENRNLIPDSPKGINKLENFHGQGCSSRLRKSMKP